MTRNTVAATLATLLLWLSAADAAERAKQSYSNHGATQAALIYRQDEAVLEEPLGGAEQEGESISPELREWSSENGDAAVPIHDEACEDCCLPCEPICGPDGQFFVRADYLIWQTRGMYLRPLVTTGTVGSQGVLGNAGTQILLGNQYVNTDMQEGGALTLGYWFDCTRQRGIEADYLALGEQAFSFAASGDDYPVLARPFTNAVTGLQSSQLVEFPNIIQGDVSVHGSADFQGGGVRIRNNICVSRPCGGENECDPADLFCRRVDLLAGYRFLRLDESLSIREDLTSIDPSGFYAIGTTLGIIDQFEVTNEFHGADVGISTEIYRGRWELELLARLALGANQQTARVSGSTRVVVPTQAPVVYDGGMYALGTNIGTHVQERFVAIPQFGANLAYQVNCRLRLLAGYNFIYWANVSRASDLIDMSINTTQLPPGALTGTARPAFSFSDSNFWAHGINVGLELRY